MALTSSFESEEAWRPTIKNTFIELEIPSHTGSRLRHKSLPAGVGIHRKDADAPLNPLQLLRKDVDGIAVDLHTDVSDYQELIRKDSDGSAAVSTDVTDGDDCTDAGSICSESWTWSPASWSSAQQPLCNQDATPEVFMPNQQCQQLNARAIPFQPKAVQTQTLSDRLAKAPCRGRFFDMFKIVKHEIEKCEYVTQVDATDCDGTWCFVVRPSGACQMDTIIEHAKKALVKSTSTCKSIYLMGYMLDIAFSAQPQGFSATLGAMENSATACWHIFKKGFCRHGDMCCKSHPVWKVPVRVLVESTSLNASPWLVKVFGEEMVDRSMAVVSALNNCELAEKVDAFKDCQGWTIEVTPKEDTETHRELIYTLAKSALLQKPTQGGYSHIMGASTHPFVSKPEGIVTLVGLMRCQSTACNDFFSKGLCNRRGCRYDHATCVMPITVIVKEKSTPMKSSTQVKVPTRSPYVDSWSSWSEPVEKERSTPMKSSTQVKMPTRSPYVDSWSSWSEPVESWNSCNSSSEPHWGYPQEMCYQ
jgi:hypothetical protein